MGEGRTALQAAAEGGHMPIFLHLLVMMRARGTEVEKVFFRRISLPPASSTYYSVIVLRVGRALLMTAGFYKMLWNKMRDLQSPRANII